MASKVLQFVLLAAASKSISSFCTIPLGTRDCLNHDLKRFNINSIRNQQASIATSISITGNADTYFHGKALGITYERKRSTLDCFALYGKLNPTSGEMEHSGWMQPVSKKPSRYSSLKSFFTSLAPVWTIIVAVISIQQRDFIKPRFGSLKVMQQALAILMLSMGLTIKPADLFTALFQKPKILLTNALLCYLVMPNLALLLARNVLSLPTQHISGLVLLGSVSGGQASNLFTLLAGGDVALSVICTISTTLLGVLVTPILVKSLIGCNAVVIVNGIEVLNSVASLVLAPILTGVALGRFMSPIVNKIIPFCPIVGILSTLVLVAGGSSSISLSTIANTSHLYKVITAACLLPILGAAVAFLVSSYVVPMSEKSKRTLVIETLSKSPTLAYILALKHFGPVAAVIPAISMVSLAIIGAFVASIWTLF